MKHEGFLALIILILGISKRCFGEDFQKRCGDCWCISDPSTDTCPEFSPGHYDSFSDPAQKAYASFKLKGEAPELKAEDGTECYPFTHLEVEGHYAAGLPQCKAPEMSDVDSAVCAFYYHEADFCEDVEYEMKTYQSKDDVPDGWVVTHTGACGACSSAADLAVMGNKGLQLNKASESCGTTYFLLMTTKDPKEAFDGLWECMKEVGYTETCSLLWAHSISTTVPLCSGTCATLVGKPYTGDAPACEQNDCIKCSEDKTSEKFTIHAGRVASSSGFTQPIARPCEDIASISHEPPACVQKEPDARGNDTDGGGDSAGRKHKSFGMAFLILLSAFFL
eukprot:CAMPEP_0183309410 /NCGR_PEP_ID=MMETSP0160_2-20130417/25327_1 /TAXON_ID=2839 ORGANISM="Odontella Sinensis, Strain Grunow 1884" /NCGR_SAMPLE_ID=MMETSP0160_2 /ASSEMBLY_ACC=CAM_ASM_000250 /LENGTH=335 /DNA_ID=CAMNT_0025473437 /DNA_START=33 /DNA_END=1040 /DNA_ORIENTATION=-